MKENTAFNCAINYHDNAIIVFGVGTTPDGKHRLQAFYSSINKPHSYDD